ncbi:MULTISPECIES: hypothetical protein [unclassified Microcoleus]|nr:MULTISPECIES: hypothetical protein [unclassified Microcoleus]
MNSRILISPYKGSGFQPILSGKRIQIVGKQSDNCSGISAV